MLHNATATGLFASPNLGLGESFGFVFSTPGTVGVQCTLHPGMAMTLIVE
jgi:plastocyanin